MHNHSRPNLFGRADLAAVYRRARDLLVEHGAFRMVRVTTDDDGASSLVICNLWRIDRSKQGGVKAFEFDLATGVWGQVTTFMYWPDVPLYPVQKAQSLDWWRNVARRVVWKALIAAGYWSLPGFSADYGPMKPSDKPEMPPSKMAYILIERYIGKYLGRTEKTGKEKWRTGFLKPEVMTAGARALRASIFDHVLEADLVSAILAVDFKVVTLCDYLRYALHRDAVLRVAQERRNLLPLLPEISKDYWSRKDLFSRKLWVRDGRKRTLVDYSRFGVGDGSRYENMQGFRSFDSRAAWRWLGKAQVTVVRRWVAMGGGRKNVAVLENLSRAQINVKIPAVAWCYIMSASTGRGLVQLGISEFVQRLYRVFAQHCAAIWKERGFAALKEWLNTGGLQAMTDWLIAEGIAQGFPDRHATWDSLQRRCNRWHERVRSESLSNQDATWDCCLGETVIDDVIFTPLNSVKAVALEGYQQHHCVGSYARDCVRGYYRVYSVLEPDGARSTLGLSLNEGGHWFVEQHRGKYNSTVSVAASHAARELQVRYSNAYRHLQQNR